MRPHISNPLRRGAGTFGGPSKQAGTPAQFVSARTKAEAFEEYNQAALADRLFSSLPEICAARPSSPWRTAAMTQPAARAQSEVLVSLHRKVRAAQKVR